jgi:hypothetical protein
VIRRASHLHDDRLFDCYLAARHGEPADPRLAEHLADCRDCAARYAELVGTMDELGVAADLDAEAIFTPERLRAQQQQIARRIEHVGRAARVISFPHHGPSVRHDRVWHRLPRFAAAAAAAGLFVGVALGALLGGPWRLWSSEGGRAGVSPRAPITAPLTARDMNLLPEPATQAADDVFWAELEMLLDRPLTRELQPLDQLTPRVRDVASVR